MDLQREIFLKGSTTYYNSTRFFPKAVKRDVFVLYAFVRRADDFVDTLPQDRGGFFRFRDLWYKALQGTPSGDPVIDPFYELFFRRGFRQEWIEAFFEAMESDLEKGVYNTIEETKQYMYGSAEVIGLCMSRIMDLPGEADYPARMLGRAMQYINFIRDIEEDRFLGRRYLPLDGGVECLDKKYLLEHQRNFERFLSIQLVRFRHWQKEAEDGYKFIPWRYLVPIKTAADSYLWTAKVIEKEPYALFERKIKPSKTFIVLTGLVNFFRCLLF